MSQMNEVLSLVQASPARSTGLGAFLYSKMRKCAKRVEEKQVQLVEECGWGDNEKRIRTDITEAEILFDCFLFRFRDIHRQMTGKTL
jgi:hypothetical protein